MFSLSFRTAGQLQFKNEEENDGNALVESDFLGKDDLSMEKGDIPMEKADT